MAYTTDDLVSDVQRDSYLPVAQRDFSPATILNLGDQELQETIAPALVAFDDGFFLEAADQAFVANQSDYDLDRYAMWGKLRKVVALTPTGQPRDLVRLTQEQVGDWDNVNSGTPLAFLPMAVALRVYPAPLTATETLRQWIYRRPGRMIPLASAAQVVSQNGSGVVTYSGAPPSGYTSSSVHDFYRGTSPFRRIATAVTASAQAGSTQTFPTATAALLVAGDYVCPRDQTVFPAIPIELHPFLKDLIIRSLARTQMDLAQYETARKEITDRMVAALRAGPGARVVGQPKKISLPVSRVRAGAVRKRFF